MSRRWELFKEGMKEGLGIAPAAPRDMRPAAIAGRLFADLALIGLCAAILWRL